jgi:hypothetical protein
MSTPDPLPDLLRARRFDEAEALCRARLQADPADLAAARFLLPHLARKGAAETGARPRPARRAGERRQPRTAIDAGAGLRTTRRPRGRPHRLHTAAGAADVDDWVAPLLLADNLERLGEADPGAHGTRAGACPAPSATAPCSRRRRCRRRCRPACNGAFLAVQRARGLELDTALAPLLTGEACGGARARQPRTRSWAAAPARPRIRCSNRPCCACPTCRPNPGSSARAVSFPGRDRTRNRSDPCGAAGPARRRRRHGAVRRHAATRTRRAAVAGTQSFAALARLPLLGTACPSRRTWRAARARRRRWRRCR